LQPFFKFRNFSYLINNISLSETLARKIKSLLDEKTLIIVSSDLSHYNPLAVAQKIDKETREIILQLKTAEAENIDACGAAGILTLMHLAKDLQWQRKLISYATSYDSSNYKDEVVGYGSFFFMNNFSLTEKIKNFFWNWLIKAFNIFCNIIKSLKSMKKN